MQACNRLRSAVSFTLPKRLILGKSNSRPQRRPQLGSVGLEWPEHRRSRADQALLRPVDHAIAYCDIYARTFCDNALARRGLRWAWLANGLLWLAFG